MASLIGGTLFIVLGVYLLLQPSKVVKTLQRFYTNYPLVRYAGQNQLQSRNSFVFGLGITFITVGALALVFA